MNSLQPNSIQTALAEWHRMIVSGDLSQLPALLHHDALFRSPMAFKPYQSAQAVAMILGTVITIFKNFVYERQFISLDSLSVTLEFSATVGDKQLKGVDLIRFDEHGKIVEFEVMIRPINATAALGEEMSKRLGALLPAFKAAP